MIAAKSIPLLIGHIGSTLLLFGPSLSPYKYDLKYEIFKFYKKKILNLGNKLCYIYYKRARI